MTFSDTGYLGVLRVKIAVVDLLAHLNSGERSGPWASCCLLDQKGVEPKLVPLNYRQCLKAFCLSVNIQHAYYFQRK